MDDRRETPLFAASRNCHEAVMQLLLERGAYVNLENIDGETPLLQPYIVLLAPLKVWSVFC